MYSTPLNPRFLFVFGLACLTLLIGCKDDDSVDEQLDNDLEASIIAAAPDGSLDFFTMPASSDLAAIPQDPKNPLTNAKVELGQLLFHETGLALAPMQPISKGTYSCASCHFAQAGFQAGRFQGISEGGIGFGNNGEGRKKMPGYDEREMDVQPLRSPSILNGAYQEVMLWNGQFGATGMNAGTESQWTVDSPKETNHLGYQGLEIQAIAGLKVHRLEVNEEFLALPGYKELFDNAFSDVPEEDRYSAEFAGLAIAAYERTVLANKSPFQNYLKGDVSALTNTQKSGAMLFFGKAKCNNCHTGPALNKMDFAAIGAGDLYQCGEATFNTPEADPANLGRGNFTGDAADNYKFKIPQLFNLKDSPFYGHGSTFSSIEQIIAYKNEAISQNSNVPDSQLSDEFVPLNLQAGEIAQIADFISNGLRDADLMRYVPESLPSGNCFPMNDLQARIDLGCD